jgi:hypothetical protein
MSGAGSPGNRHRAAAENSMRDLLMILLTAGFFALAVLYVAACGKLRKK